jgi:hypothetical protein
MHLLNSIDFEIPIISRILCILTFLIIAFKKSFKNATHGHLSLNFLVRTTNLKHELKIFLGIFFKGNLKVILFLCLYYAINWVNTNYLRISKVKAINFLKRHFN